MRGGAHLGIGVGSTLAGLYGLQALGAPLDPPTIVFGALAAGLGALAPDVDHPRSTASKSLPDKLFGQAIEMFLPLVVLGVFFYALAGRSVGTSLVASLAPLFQMAGVMLGFAVVFVLASSVARRYTTHRGATHSLLVAGIATLFVILGCLMFSLPGWYGLLFGWGWLTHIGADATTRMGVPALLWWPFGKRQTPAVVSTPVSRHVRETPPEPIEVPVTAEPVAPFCPSCGIPMVLRRARRGAHQGDSFYGCANFPSCRQTKSAHDVA